MSAVIKDFKSQKTLSDNNRQDGTKKLLKVNNPRKLNKNNNKNNLIGILLEKGLLTKDQIKVARTQANKTGDSIIDVLIQLNFITDSVVNF